MSIWTKYFRKKEEPKDQTSDDLTETFKLSKSDVQKAKSSGNINGDPVLKFGKNK
jgi:hypothetical protein